MKNNFFALIAISVITLQCSADSYGIQHSFINDEGPGCILHWEAWRTTMVGIGLTCSSPANEGPFTIYRNGEKIAVVSNSTWFRDMDTVAGRAYSYQIAGYGKITTSRTVICPKSYSVSIETPSQELPWRETKESISVSGIKQQWTNLHYGENLSYTGEYYLLETSAQWTAESDSSWIRFTGSNAKGYVSGNGSAEIELQISENNTGTVREGLIIVKCDGITVKSILMTQAAKPDEIMPQIGEGEDGAHVHDVVASIGFADPDVVNLIGGNAAEYSNFRTWAQSVEGGEEAVVASKKAGVSYRLGAKRLFVQTPKVTLGNIVIEHAATKQVSALSMTVSVSVADGTEDVEVSLEKVAEMFEATSDLADWNGSAKLAPKVEALGVDGTDMRFRVTPGDGTAKRAFLRIRL